MHDHSSHLVYRRESTRPPSIWTKNNFIQACSKLVEHYDLYILFMVINVSGSSNGGIPNGCEKREYSFSVCVLLVVIIMLHTGMILISDDTDAEAEADADDVYDEANSELQGLDPLQLELAHLDDQQYASLQAVQTDHQSFVSSCFNWILD